MLWSGYAKIKDKKSLTSDIKNFKDALKENNHTDAFMNAASPGVISAFLPNKFYKNDDEYLEKLSIIPSGEGSPLPKLGYIPQSPVQLPTILSTALFVRPRGLQFKRTILI